MDSGDMVKLQPAALQGRPLLAKRLRGQREQQIFSSMVKEVKTLRNFLDPLCAKVKVNQCDSSFWPVYLPRHVSTPQRLCTKI